MNPYRDDRDLTGVFNEMGRSPTNSLERDDSSLESIGQFGFTDAFSVHAMSRENSFVSMEDGPKRGKRVTWKKNVKAGKYHMGCMPALGAGCGAFPQSFGTNNTPSGVRGNIGRTFQNGPARKKNFLQKFADIAISNVQRCGISSHCGGGEGMNMKALSALLGGEMCTRCGVVDGGGCDIANGKCAQCQSFFRAYERGDCRPVRNFNIGARVGKSRHQYTMADPVPTNPRYHTDPNAALLQETRDIITQSRDVIVDSRNAILETRLEMIRSEEELRESRECIRNVLDSHGGVKVNNNEAYHSVTRYTCNDDWERGNIVSPRSILKKRGSFCDDGDENNGYVSNYKNETFRRSPKNKGWGRVGNKLANSSSTVKTKASEHIKPNQKKKIIGRFVIRRLMKPIQVVTCGMKSRGPKRVLAITSRESTKNRLNRGQVAINHCPPKNVERSYRIHCIA
eukprot:CCRYP_016720-RA/>CCRYP_016720-RA protein AED:0.39 eAED:0.82 QI:0/0/0.33/1/0/0/3/472/453